MNRKGKSSKAQSLHMYNITYIVYYNEMDIEEKKK